MASNRQLLETGSARRADLVKIWIDEIHVEPDFNAPESPEDFEQRVEGIALHLANGGKFPPLEVRDRAEGGVYVVDGHARRAGTLLAMERGVPLQDPKDGRVYLLTIPFVGNDADRTLRVITSAEGRTLTPLQMAAMLKRLRNFDWPVDEIAKRINRSPERVSQLLALADANTDVQQLVKSGEVSANVAIKAARKHGEGAGKVLAEQLTDAKAAGKKRLTTATAEPKKVKASELEEERARCTDLLGQVARLRAALQFYADESHFVRSDSSAWDTVSGEPQNFHEDEAGTAMVEDGSIARLALADAPTGTPTDAELVQLAAQVGLGYTQGDRAGERLLNHSKDDADITADAVSYARAALSRWGAIDAARKEAEHV